MSGYHRPTRPDYVQGLEKVGGNVVGRRVVQTAYYCRKSGLQRGGGKVICVVPRNAGNDYEIAQRIVQLLKRHGMGDGS